MLVGLDFVLGLFLRMSHNYVFWFICPSIPVLFDHFIFKRDEFDSSIQSDRMPIYHSMSFSSIPLSVLAYVCCVAHLGNNRSKLASTSVVSPIALCHDVMGN